MYNFFVLLTVILFAGCSLKTVPKAQEITPMKVQKKLSDTMYYLSSSDVARHTPQSGLYPLHNNLDAFMARVGLIKEAKKSLDLQYFIYADDETAYAVTALLIQAADRGVHVRVLVDDLLKKDKDVEITALATHPNIEIKLFNPTTMRRFSGWVQMAFNINTLGRRMHNKILVADNSAVVLGGRNIENLYFAADKDKIFIDNDILAIGPLARDASEEFEIYWQSPMAVNIEKLSKNQSKKEYKKLLQELKEYLGSIEYKEYMGEVKKRAFAKAFMKKSIPLIYAQTKLYYDYPTKITTSTKNDSTHLSKDILPYMLAAKKSIKIINPYFIPSKKMMSYIKLLRAKGVEITILTNSLATNDAIAVYASYSKFQRELLKLGVRLYELNPYSFSYIYKHQHYRKGSIPRSSLHAKSIIIDDDIFIIGSANLDPRSIKLNTEVVAVVHSKEFVAIETKVFKEATRAENIFTLSLERQPHYDCAITCIPQQENRLVWRTKKDGVFVEYYNEGDAGFWRRVGAAVSRYFPSLEKYL